MAYASEQRDTFGVLRHCLWALYAVSQREVIKFVYQRSRFLSALVRPLLWLVVFGAGLRNILGISIIDPYDTYLTYDVYMIPGLLGLILLFQTMQSSLSMVYDREMGMMRLLLTAPLPRWLLLLYKLIAATLLAILQCYVFLAIVMAVGVDVPWMAWLTMLPALLLGGMMMGAIGLLLSVYVRQLENFAGTMNFVIFPMFFISSALFPLYKFEDAGAYELIWIAQFNPFKHAVEFIRWSSVERFDWLAPTVVIGVTALMFFIAVIGYDPQRGFVRKRPKGKPG